MILSHKLKLKILVKIISKLTSDLSKKKKKVHQIEKVRKTW